ncbi:hypothetical protein L228DRAFT_248517 [Xylona heveae TC161]|uniref:Uncharacterized protein n=1 Tax=Xylona heveae (strain CBS 132557 / TC161) TaxID=1328760 RepID=A0A165G5X4_XYLHT|nr:hypothetical protein L228DRAFT_248517 [Xylona heveae TC161]KZF21774.1 hypothetical protein L228DRAFT_248517 [Xylona heveae TC161]
MKKWVLVCVGLCGLSFSACSADATLAKADHIILLCFNTGVYGVIGGPWKSLNRVA